MRLVDKLWRPPKNIWIFSRPRNSRRNFCADLLRLAHHHKIFGTFSDLHLSTLYNSLYSGDPLHLHYDSQEFGVSQSRQRTLFFRSIDETYIIKLSI